MSEIDRIFGRMEQYENSMISAFVDRLRELLARAQARTIGELQSKLMIEGGIVGRNPGNSTILRRLAQTFATAADDAGIPELVRAFAGTFDGSLTFMDEIWEQIRDAAKRPLPALRFNVSDEKLAGAMKINAASSIEGVIDAAAMKAGQRALFSVGALPFGDLVELISENVGNSVAQAQTQAATAQSTFYRAIQGNQLERVEAGMPGVVMRYRYAGPKDRLTRPFCEAALSGRRYTDTGRNIFVPKAANGRSYTREEIDSMSNGSIPGVWTSCGAFNCRHSWILDVQDLNRQLKAAA